MNNYALSRNKLKYIINLRPDYKAVLDTIVALAGKYDIVNISQKTLSKIHNVSLRTISTIISHLKKLGLLVVKHRWKSSNETYLSEYFTLPDVRASMYKLFKSYPSFQGVILSLSLLKSSFAHHYNIRGLLRFLSYKSPSKRRYIVQSRIDKMRKIALALRERGAKLSNEDALWLFAFDESIHDRVIPKMKDAKIDFPAAFYFSQLRQLAVWEKAKIDNQLVAQLRDENFRLIPDAEPKQVQNTPKMEILQKAAGEKTHKREDRTVISFAESIRLSRELDVEKEKEEARELIRKQMAENKDYCNPFAAILLGKGSSI